MALQRLPLENTTGTRTATRESRVVRQARPPALGPGPCFPNKSRKSNYAADLPAGRLRRQARLGDTARAGERHQPRMAAASRSVSDAYGREWVPQDADAALVA